MENLVVLTERPDASASRLIFMGAFPDALSFFVEAISRTPGEISDETIKQDSATLVKLFSQYRFPFRDGTRSMKEARSKSAWRCRQ